jgi:hypothetical protein
MIKASTNAPKYRASLSIDRAAHRHEHPCVAATSRCSGFRFLTKRQVKRALDEYHESLRINRAAYDSGHSIVAATLQCWGFLFYDEQRQCDGALVEYRESLHKVPWALHSQTIAFLFFSSLVNENDVACTTSPLLYLQVFIRGEQGRKNVNWKHKFLPIFVATRWSICYCFIAWFLPPTFVDASGVGEPGGIWVVP